jgi:hypothetical protein
VVTNTLKITRGTMLLLATSNGVGVNVRLVGYGLSISRYQGIYNAPREIFPNELLISFSAIVASS